MSPEKQTKTKTESIVGGLLDKNGKPTDEHLRAHWSVENGELVNDGHGLYLTTDKDYGDFELHPEYKALPNETVVFVFGTQVAFRWLLSFESSGQRIKSADVFSIGSQRAGYVDSGSS